jgi:trigger factor
MVETRPDPDALQEEAGRTPEVAGGPELSEADATKETDTTTSQSPEGEPKKDGLLLKELVVHMEDVGPCRKKVQLRVPAAEIERLKTEQLREFAKKAWVPGFRPGRAPVELVFRRFRHEFLEELRNLIVGQAFRKLLDDHQLEIVEEPNLDVSALTLPESGQDFVIELEVETQPEFTLPEYKGLKVRRPIKEIGEEDVRAYLEHLRRRQHVVVPADPSRGVRLGDIVLADFVFYLPDHSRELKRLPDFYVNVLENCEFQDVTIPDFGARLTGLQRGQTIRLRGVLSDSLPQADLQGKPVDVDVTIKSVFDAISPPPDDQTLAEAFGYASVDELLDGIYHLLIRQFDHYVQEEIRRQIMDQLLASAAMEVPQSLITRQTDLLLRREMRRLRQAGYSPGDVATRLARMRHGLRERTERALKEHFLLSRIAKQENLTVRDSDVEDYIEALARVENVSPRRVRLMVERQGLRPEIEGEILERLALERIIDTCEFEDVPVQDWMAPAAREQAAEPLLLPTQSIRIVPEDLRTGTAAEPTQPGESADAPTPEASR